MHALLGLPSVRATRAVVPSVRASVNTTAHSVPGSVCNQVAQAPLRAVPCLLHFVRGIDAGTAVVSDDAFGHANQAAHESIQAIRTVHSYNLQQRVVATYNHHLARPIARMGRAGMISGFAFGVSQFVMFAFFSLAFWCDRDPNVAYSIPLSWRTRETVWCTFTCASTLIVASFNVMRDIPSTSEGRCFIDEMSWVDMGSHTS